MISLFLWCIFYIIRVNLLIFRGYMKLKWSSGACYMGLWALNLALHIIIKPLWSATAVINFNESWAVLQVYQCCTRSFIRPTHLQIHSWQDSALSKLASPHLHQLQQFPSPSSSPPPQSSHLLWLWPTPLCGCQWLQWVPGSLNYIFSFQPYPLKISWLKLFGVSRYLLFFLLLLIF